MDMAKGIFITGTDTGIGKTEIALALIEKYKQQGLQVAAMKPVASGSQWVNGKLQNDDAQRLQNACSASVDYEQVNPYAFEEPIAPHIAANNAGVRIDLERIADDYNTLASKVDIVVVEGVGGWMVPLNETMRVADLARRLALPSVLVVGMRLGCLNHALLTDEAMHHCDVECAGWVANTIEADFAYLQDNVETLKRAIASPLLGVIDYQSPPQTTQVAQQLSL
jgi:dethiobiotin synthetase